MNQVIDIEVVKRDFITNAMKMANQLNAIAADEFEGAARNRAMYWFQVKSPKPIAPRAVEVVFNFEPTWKFEFVPTQAPVSTLDPDVLLPPPPPNDVNAIGGPVGALIIDDVDLVKNKYSLSSTDNMAPGSVYRDMKSGRRFVKVAEGFAGLRKYWIELT